MEKQPGNESNTELNRTEREKKKKPCRCSLPHIVSIFIHMKPLEC
jgi:hypothetical protein